MHGNLVQNLYGKHRNRHCTVYSLSDLIKHLSSFAHTASGDDAGYISSFLSCSFDFESWFSTVHEFISGYGPKKLDEQAIHVMEFYAVGEDDVQARWKVYPHDPQWFTEIDGTPLHMLLKMPSPEPKYASFKRWDFGGVRPWVNKFFECRPDLVLQKAECDEFFRKAPASIKDLIRRGPAPEKAVVWRDRFAPVFRALPRIVVAAPAAVVVQERVNPLHRKAHPKPPRIVVDESFYEDEARQHQIPP